MKVSTNQRIDLQCVGNSSVDLGSASITVTDSTSGNSVQINGIEPDAIGREVKYWCRSQRYCHNAATRETAKENLQAILNACQDSLQYLKEEEAKEAEAAS
jgi:hypothetical protein